MESHHQQTNMCKISEVTVKDLPKINELENQLNLNKTKLNFFNQTLSNENFKFIKLVLENEIIGFLQLGIVIESDSSIMMRFHTILLLYVRSIKELYILDEQITQS